MNRKPPTEPHPQPPTGGALPSGPKPYRAPQPRRCCRIVLTGGPGGGKTTAADLFRSPEVLAAARLELEQKRGADFRYQAMVGDRAPPLDYRKPMAANP